MTVRIAAVVRADHPRAAPTRPPHPASTFVTTAKRPSCETGRGDIIMISGKKKVLFCPRLDGLLSATNPLPMKNGERERTAFVVADVTDLSAGAVQTSPRPLRGEVGLRSNPGEGHGTYEARIACPSDGHVNASCDDVIAAQQGRAGESLLQRNLHRPCGRPSPQPSPREERGEGAHRHRRADVRLSVAFGVQLLWPGLSSTTHGTLANPRNLTRPPRTGSPFS
ncbi:hypothetical protein ACVILH_006098 [Bradyrhizobium sp. USDA 4353]